ncbi:MAG: hypothetical protein H6661_02025 [Ardenticatenaceae bacterium]|nr:hypothetical protein [Ardenticatenaceae bacterium]
MTFLAKPNFVQGAANLATILLVLFMGVQLLLAVGILPISVAWGGRQMELTLGLRVASIAAILVLGLFIYIVRYRAGLLGSVPAPKSVHIMAWVVTGFMALNTLGNFASLSSVERLLFGPVALLITAACLIVAASQTN